MVFAKKRFLVMVLSVILILCASFSFVYAMGFDAEKVYDSVYVVYSGENLGSGFAIGGNCIITNAHICSANSQTKIETYKGEKIDTQIYNIDEGRDLAILVIEDSSLVPLKMADLNQVSVGDDVYAIGAPESLSFTLTKGIVSSLKREYEGRIFIQTDAPINAGNSGGPLLNDNGKVIGINSYRISQSDGLGLAIPVDQVKEYLASLNITIDENGNVTDKLTVTNNQVVENNDTIEIYEEENMSVIVGLSIVLGLSVILNIVLIVLLVFKNKKSIIKKDDPANNTDFEIDILE